MVFNNKNIGCFSDILANNCPTPDNYSQCERSYNSYVGSTYDIYGHKICFFCKVFRCFHSKRREKPIRCQQPHPVIPNEPPMPA